MPANIMLPTNAKMTALVCSGRRRPKLSQAVLKLACQKLSCEAIEHAHQHSHDAPDQGREQELADDCVVEFESDLTVGHRWCYEIGYGGRGSAVIDVGGGRNRSDRQ